MSKTLRVKGKPVDVVFLVTFAEIMNTKMSARERAIALDKLNRKVTDSLASRMFK